MPADPEVERKIAEYLQSDLSVVRKRYEDLFGKQQKPEESQLGQNEEDAAALEEPGNPNVRKGRKKADVESEFSEVLAGHDLTEPVKDMVQKAWRWVASGDRPIAIYHLNIAGVSRTFTLDYELEGLFLFFGVSVASHIIYRYFPGGVFPIDDEMGYDKFRGILRTYGIDYDDSEEQLAVNVLFSLGEAVEKYRESKALEDWQMWALVYDLGPLLLPPPPPYPTDPPPCVWLTATQPGDYENVDKHLSSDQAEWSINAKARRGDLVLMYNLAPRSAITAIYRCASDAFRNPFNSGWAAYRALSNYLRPSGNS